MIVKENRLPPVTFSHYVPKLLVSNDRWHARLLARVGFLTMLFPIDVFSLERHQ